MHISCFHLQADIIDAGSVFLHASPDTRELPQSFKGLYRLVEEEGRCSARGLGLKVTR